MNGSGSRITLALAVLALSGTASADNLWLGVKAGTLGLGVEGTWRPLPWFDVRAGLNRYDYEDTGGQAGINYDGELALDSYYATGNLRFPLSPMRLTVGAFANNNEFALVSQDALTYDVGGSTYTAPEVGTLRGTASFDGTSPYLGIGFDFELFNKVGMNFDLGVLWQGEPEVTLTADGLAASDPNFQAALEAERQELQDEVEDMKAWPVVSVGFNFNFF